MSRERPRAVPATLGKAFDRCPFRSIIGVSPPAMDKPLADMLPRLAHALAVLGGDPAPIDPSTMAELVASIQAGGCVLLMSDRADLRDYAKREILAMLMPAAGRA